MWPWCTHIVSVTVKLLETELVELTKFKHVNAGSVLSPAFTSVEKWQQCHPVTIQVVHTTLQRVERLRLEKSPPTAPPTRTESNTQKKKLRGKSLGEKPPIGRAGWWDVGLIKSCCHCGVLVTRSHKITEISVWEESVPTTHFLPIEGGEQNGAVSCTKYQKKRESFFIYRNLRIQKGRKGQGGGRRRMRRNSFVFE